MIVNSLVIDLCQNGLLGEEKRDNIMRMSDTRDVVKLLFGGIRDSDDDGEEKVNQTLYKHNPRVIKDIKVSEPHKRSQGSGMSTISYTEMTEDDIVCKLCNKLNQDPVEVITPIIIGGTYRLSMNYPGLFRCSESGIQFRVKQPVTLEYEVDSWSNYTEILQNLLTRYEIIGPLYNIKSNVEANVVSEVFLPHCLCLGGFEEDKSLIQCFHYKHDNITLETPSRIEAMYAVLENPTFSCHGVILSSWNRLMRKPCHGMVLLFCNTIIKDNQNHMYRLHLYLLPRIRTLVKEVERDKQQFSFKRIPKPPQTKSVYPKKEYKINGPEIASVNPKSLLFESCPPEIYSYTEIKMEGEANTVVNVSILPVDEDDTVWETEVSAEEMLNVTSSISRPGISRSHSSQCVHFLDEHRAYLISSITGINQVIDDLLHLRLLNYEQYETVSTQNTNPGKMRKLYDYIRAFSDDDKDKVYRSIRTHNYPIIRQLEGEGPTERNEPHNLDHNFRCYVC
ncbi:NACHT, LRR and PYD domains-containing protein 1a-like [Ranitomeya variabilis]|uniref:NACHT, LRR and PYD domains-containing protein 1a-like n=1 Tax=Ranitomeya variabilis TaxID=490064 RepID=UPI004057B02A